MYSLVQKEKAINLRTYGKSLREIEKILYIPRSTLTNWFKSITLTKRQKKVLKIQWQQGLIKARKRAAIQNAKNKQARIEIEKRYAFDLLKTLDLNDPKLLEIGLSILYFAEGFKSKYGCGLGNTDPLILNFFIHSIHRLYKVEQHKIRCELHLRADQDPEIEKKYWSNTLQVPLSGFTSISIDKRTMDSKTYNTYHGVCVIRYGNIAIQRRLVFIARSFCKCASYAGTVSSAGRAFA